MDVFLIGSGLLIVGGLIGLWLLVRRLRGGGSASKRAHEEAQDRAPPVEIGESYQFGITEFTDHHSGEQVAVGKVEGFVIFAEGVPEDAAVGDVVDATVVSFNRGRTSADATVNHIK